MGEQQSSDVFTQVTVSWSGTYISAYNLLFVVSPVSTVTATAVPVPSSLHREH